MVGKIRSFPIIIPYHENINKFIENDHKKVKIQLKKNPQLHLSIGHVELTVEEIYCNINIVVNCVIGNLPLKWGNIKSIFVKSSMGPSFRLF